MTKTLSLTYLLFLPFIWWLLPNFSIEKMPAAEVEPPKQQKIRMVCDPDRDRAALIRIFQENNGVNWDSSRNWLTNAPIEDWYGVSVENGCVVDLFLAKNNLANELSDAIGDFSELRILSLELNDLSGAIPSSLGNLESLTELYLSGNQFTSIENGLGQLSNLIFLSITDNPINDAIPEEIGQLTNLQTLYLSNNGFTGDIPNSFRNLQNLKLLSLSSNNSITGNITDAITSLINLEHLYLHENMIGGNVPEELANLMKLQSLYLFSNQLEGCFSEKLNVFCGLEQSNDSNNPGYDFRGNSGLSNNGDFQGFCLDTVESCEEENTCTFLEITITNQSAPTCNNVSDGLVEIAVSNGTAPFTYDFNDGNGPVSETALRSLRGGDYTINVSDATNCTGSFSFSLVEPSAMELTISSTPTLCSDSNDGQATVTVSGGTPNYTYSWNTGPTTASINSLAAGTYTVTVTDTNGCTIQQSTTITAPTALALNITSTDNTSCNGTNDGTASVSVSGGTLDYTYLWSTGATTASINNLATGDYTVTVTDRNGCTSQQSTSVNDPAGVVASIVSVEDITCGGNTDGVIEFTVSGGTPPYAYSLDGVNFQNGTIINNLAAGDYTVTVSDNNSCTTTFNAIINPSINLSFAENTTNNICYGDNISLSNTSTISNGNVTAVSWNINGTTFTGSTITTTLSELGNPMVTMTITTDLGCTETISRTLDLEVLPCCDSRNAIIITPTIQNPTCNSISDGSIAVALSSSPPVTSIAWDNGATTANIENLASGPYTITVTNDATCEEVTAYSLAEESPVTTSLQNTICEGGNVSFGGTVINTAGTYRDTLLTSIGCDSIVILTLAVTNLTELSSTVTRCEGDSLNFNGRLLKIAGQYFDTTRTAFGCDSIIEELTLTFLTDTPIVATAFTCNPEDAGIDTISVPSSLGCDSTVITETFLSRKDTIRLPVQSSCDTTLVGSDTLTLSNQFGCDSLVITTTIFDETIVSSLEMNSTCDPDAVGLDTLRLTNQFGCDSLAITRTTLNPSNDTLIIKRSCDMDQVGIDSNTLSNQFGCDSVVTIETIFDESVKMEFVELTTCTASEMGVDTTELKASDGCDSMVITTTQFTLIDTTFLMEETCDVSEMETIVQNLISSNGCDSVVITEIRMVDLFSIALENDNYVVTTSEESVTLTITENDILPIDQNEWTVNIVDFPIEGTVVIDDEEEVIEYELMNNLANRDSFRYQICLVECPEVCEVATVFITFDNDCLGQSVENIPSAFSPDSDFGENKVFDPIEEFKSCGITKETNKIEFVIFNRWGETVFAPSDYEAWDGYRVGATDKMMPQATYYYWLKIPQPAPLRDKIFKGAINLLRQ